MGQDPHLHLLGPLGPFLVMQCPHGAHWWKCEVVPGFSPHILPGLMHGGPNPSGHLLLGPVREFPTSVPVCSVLPSQPGLLSTALFLECGSGLSTPSQRCPSALHTEFMYPATAPLAPWPHSPPFPALTVLVVPTPAVHQPPCSSTESIPMEPLPQQVLQTHCLWGSARDPSVH